MLQILAIDVVNAHRAAIDAARAGDRRIAFGDRDFDVLEAAIRSPYMFRQGAAAAIRSQRLTDRERRQKDQTRGLRYDFHSILLHIDDGLGPPMPIDVG